MNMMGAVDVVGGAGVECWTFAAVEGRFIEAMRFAWRDEPGRWPFAGDGPWSLIRAERGDYDARGGDMDAPPLPRVPLTRAQRARMDECVAWLAFVTDDGADRMIGGDAKLIVRVARKLGAHRGEGRGQVPWIKLLAPMGVKKGAGMLAKRYSRAITRICERLNKQRVPVDMARED